MATRLSRGHVDDVTHKMTVIKIIRLQTIVLKAPGGKTGEACERGRSNTETKKEPTYPCCSLLPLGCMGAWTRVVGFI